MNSDITNISVFGLGKLGASMAAGFASRGFNVVGVDINDQSVRAINEGRAPVQETGLAELISANRERLRATGHTTAAIQQTQISFIIVPTPSDSRGAFSLQYAAAAFRKIGEALKTKDSYHVIVLTSTVLPGATRHGLLPLLEKYSGRKCGVDFGLCYSPEFIALGSVIRDLFNPDFYLIGEFDKRSGDCLEEVNRRTSHNNAPNKRMTIENAELAKVAINSYVTLKISFANLMADMCERIPKGDVDVISDALGMDKRIGRKYLTGGLGFGGPCFPRDNVALAFTARQLGANCELLETNDHYNRGHTEQLVAKLMTRLKKGSTVAVLGLAYKALSHVVEDSPGMALCRLLSDAGCRVIGFDPLASGQAEPLLKYSVMIVHSLSEALLEAEAVLVTTNNAEFLNIRPSDLAPGVEKVLVVDFWRILPPELTASEKVEYWPMGRCQDESATVTKLRQLWGPPP